MDDVAVRILVFEHPLVRLDAEAFALDLLGQPLPGFERDDDRRGLLRAVFDLTARALEDVERRPVEGGDGSGFGGRRRSS